MATKKDSKKRQMVEKIEKPAPSGKLKNKVDDVLLDRYFDVTGRALKKVKITESGKINWKASAEDFLDMAQRYFDDAKYFRQKGEYATAFAALNYAHGWLDAGARLGLFDVGKDNVLFTVDDE